ncbi:MAG: glycosyltransferase family 9 protein [Elusimicrobiota bacterium]
MEFKAGKILVVNLGGLGDIVMMTPILKAVKKKYPGSSISLLTIPRSLEISKNLSGIDRFYTLPMTFKTPSPFFFLKLLRAALDLRKERFDALIDFKGVQTTPGSLKMFLLVKIINAKTSIGRNLGGKGWFFDHKIKETVNKPNTEVEHTLKLLEPLEITEFDKTIEYPVTRQDTEFIDSELKKLNIDKAVHKLIGLNPGAFRPSRRWPIDSWKDLINLLTVKYPDCRIFITGEQSELTSIEKLKISDNVIVTNGKYSIGQLAALFSKLDVFITNDTGPMHLAAAAGAKITAIFGPGDVHRFSPSVAKEKYRIVRKDIPGCERPCYKFSCDNPVCLTGIQPAEVFAAADNLLKSGKQQ